MKKNQKTPEALQGLFITILAPGTRQYKTLTSGLQAAGVNAVHEETMLDLLHTLSQKPANALIIDLSYCSNFDNERKKDIPSLSAFGSEIIVASEAGETEAAAEWARAFQGYILPLPAELDELIILLERALDAGLMRNRLARYESADPAMERFGSMAVKSPEMMDVLRLARILSNRDDAVLLNGPVGSGKEQMARAIHDHSQRRHAPYYEINCRSFSAEELAAQLFGSDSGKKAKGKKKKDEPACILEMAHGGSLLIDEINVLPEDLQTRLHRLIADASYSPVDSDETKQADIRIFAASSQPLDEMCAKGEFSEALYFHLSRFVLHMPALRRRIEDIPVLTKAILERIANEKGVEALRINEPALRIMMEYNWPGNIRELENVLEFASLVAGDGQIEPQHLPKQFHEDMGSLFATGDADTLPPMSEIERRYIMKVMEACQGNKVKAAAILDINRATLHRKLQIYENLRNFNINIA